MIYVDSESGKVCCEERLLEGESLAILTHGYLSGKMSRTNSALLPLLSGKGISVIAFDMYGHGGSEGDVERLTVSKVVDNALAVFDHAKDKGYTRIALAASSFSGQAALISATKRRFSALALRCPVFDGKRLWDSVLGPEGVALWKARGSIKPFSREWRFEAYEDESGYDMRAVAAQVGAPTLVIHGDKDATVPISQARELVSCLGCEKKLVVVQGADHFFGPAGHFQAVLGETSGWLVSHL